MVNGVGSAPGQARAAMAEVLGYTPTERAAERCLAFLQREEEEVVALSLA